MTMFCKTSLILLQIILISMKISAQVTNPLLFQLNTGCHCNGNSEYDFSLGQEIGHCNSLFPYGSPNGHLWCYVEQRTSACNDVLPSQLRPGRFYSFKACAKGGMRRRRKIDNSKPIVETLLADRELANAVKEPTSAVDRESTKSVLV